MRIAIPLLMVMLVMACDVKHPEVVHTRQLGDLRPVDLPAYDDEYFIQFTGTPEQYSAARMDDRFVMEEFTYDSGGLVVGAYLYRQKVPPANASPVVIFVRGSFRRDNPFPGEILTMAHRYGQAGFIVVAPHIRGSLGWPGVDELGGAELDDIRNLVPQIDLIKGADPRRIFLAGESRGGAEVYMLVRDGFPALAAAVWGAFTDVEALLQPDSPQAKFAPAIWPDLETNREAIVTSRSALRWADRLDVPLLIMHGSDDDAIPPRHSELMDKELTRLGKPHKFILFDGEGHMIGGRSEERDAEAIAWFERFGSG